MSHEFSELSESILELKGLKYIKLAFSNNFIRNHIHSIFKTLPMLPLL